MKKVKVIIEYEVEKNIGYFVGFGGLNEGLQKAIAEKIKKDGTFKIKGIDGYVGYWYNSIKGKPDIEKSRHFIRFKVAYKHGKIRGEEAIWDCKDERSIWLKKQKDKVLIKHVKTDEYEYWIYK